MELLHSRPSGIKRTELLNIMLASGWNPLDVQAVLDQMEHDQLLRGSASSGAPILLSSLGISRYFELQQQFEISLVSQKQNRAQFIVQVIIAITGGLTALLTLLFGILK